jgi:hypothetical protein
MLQCGLTAKDAKKIRKERKGKYFNLVKNRLELGR